MAISLWGQVYFNYIICGVQNQTWGCYLSLHTLDISPHNSHNPHTTCKIHLVYNFDVGNTVYGSMPGPQNTNYTVKRLAIPAADGKPRSTMRL